MLDLLWATGQEHRVSMWTHQPGIHEAHRLCRSSSSTHLGNRNMNRRVWQPEISQKELLFVMVCGCDKKEHCWNSVSYLPAFSSSHCARRGRCTVKWAPLLWASESDHCSDSDSLPIHLLARNRNDRQSAGSWRCCIGPSHPPGNQTSLPCHCLEERKGLEGGEEWKRRQVEWKEKIKAKQSQTIIPLMSHWCLLKVAVRTGTISHGQLSLRGPEQTVGGITIAFSLLKTSQLQSIH